MRALAIVVIAACSTSPSNIVATLELAVATVERMPGQGEAWKAARKGDTFVIGSAIRTGPASTAKLRVGKAGKLDVQPQSVVYFTRDGKRRRDAVKVETGSVEIEAGDEVVGLGEATLEPGGRARVASGPSGTTIVVTLGRVVLEDNVIEAGKSITLSATGTAVVPPQPTVVAPAETVTVGISGKPARARTSGGETELAIGEHAIATNATIVTPVDGAASITADGREGGSAEFPGGTMRVPGGAAGTAHVEKTGTQITAQRGSIAIETANRTETIAQGESVSVTPKGVIERLPPPPKHTVATIEAGESPVVHDAKAPSGVRVQFKCGGAGTVEVAKDRAFKRIVARSGGSDAANVLVPAGTFSYRVRCARGKSASGTIRVARDAGSRPLPKTAAKTTVELDGRAYTIYYQNLLPELTLSLRNAPRSLEYRFVVKSGSGEKRYDSMTPKTTLPAGELREGKYTVWAELDGGRRSEQSRVTIEFDNAAASASIDGVDGDTVRGTVIEGTTVSIAGAPVELDRHRRFTASLPAAGDHATAVRIAHPKAGVHYYVVRNGAH